MARGRMVASFSLLVLNVTGWMASMLFLVSRFPVLIVLSDIFSSFISQSVFVLGELKCLFPTVSGKVIDGLLVMRKIEVNTRVLDISFNVCCTPCRSESMNKCYADLKIEKQSLS